MKTGVYVYFLAGIAFVSSCSKEPCSKEPQLRTINSDDRSSIPYKGDEKLTFIELSTKDTFHFIGRGSYRREVEGGEGCPTYYNLEQYSLLFEDAISKSNIFISFEYDVPGSSAHLIINKTYKTISAVVTSKYKYEYDSLLIQGKMYYKIHYFRNQDSYLIKNGCYYNLTEGIVKMEVGENDSWELLKIE